MKYYLIQSTTHPDDKLFTQYEDNELHYVDNLIKTINYQALPYRVFEITEKHYKSLQTCLKSSK